MFAGKKVFYYFSLILILLLLPISTALAQQNIMQGERVSLGKGQTINSDYFATGENINLSGTVNGDAYLAGGVITVDGTVNGDLLVAGGDINILGTVNGDVRAAGGSIIISGQVTRNITVTGGSVNLTPEARIDGSLVAGAGKLSINAPLGKGLIVGAGQLVLNNAVGGDVVGGVGELNLNPNSRINGNLTYWSNENAQIAPEASVSGKIIHNLPPEPSQEVKRDAQSALLGFVTIFKLMGFVSTLILGLLLLRFFPIFSSKVAETIVVKPWVSLGIGFLSLIAFPVLFIVLAITIIGLPIALILLVSFIIGMYISKIFVALLIGQKVLGFFNSKKTNLYLTYLLGLLLFYILSLVPIVGGLVTGIAMLSAFGALLIQKKNSYLSLRNKKVI